MTQRPTTERRPKAGSPVVVRRVVDLTDRNVDVYQPRSFPLFAAERRILRRLLRPGMRVLDLGCGDGRVARQLPGWLGSVWACDLKDEALRDLRRSPSAARVHAFRGDARAQPLGSRTFDLVIFAYNGLDWLHPEEARLRALREMERVVVPGGRVVFSSHNPVGELLSPRGLRSGAIWRARGRFLPPRSPGYVGREGLMLHYASPADVIAQVERHTDLRLEEALATRSGRRLPLPLLTAVSAWPTYVFRPPA